jgi:hypothetical protein
MKRRADEFSQSELTAVTRTVAQVCARRPDVADECRSRVLEAIANKRRSNERIKNLEAFAHATARHALADLVQNTEARTIVDDLVPAGGNPALRAVVARDLDNPDARREYRHRGWSATLADEHCDFEWQTEDEYRDRIVDKFYDRLAWLALDDLAKRLDGELPGQGSIARSLMLWRQGEPAFAHVGLDHVAPQSNWRSERARRQDYDDARRAQRVVITPNPHFRAEVIERWRHPVRFDLRPLPDGSIVEFGAAELTRVSLMLGARPRALDPATGGGVSLRDLYSAEFEIVMKALQRRKK